MSYLAILEIVTLAFAICECLAAGHERLQRQIYYLAFAWVVIWSTAKYAYGPDITAYIPFYDLLSNPFSDVQDSRFIYEKGFTFFCSTLKMCGFSFWGMTAVLSLLFFSAIFLLWRQIRVYKTVALLSLVWMTNELFLIQLRQCLSVTCFIFCVLLFQNRKYAGSVLFALFAILTHKSSWVLVPLVGLLYMMRNISVPKRTYILWAFLLIGIVFIPFHQVIIPVINKFLPFGLAESLAHHLELGKFFQKIFVLYFMTIICLAYYKQEDAENKTWHWLMWCTLGVVVCLYPYYFLLNRIRSFFAPYLIVYMANMFTSSHIKQPLLRQLYTCLLLVFVLGHAYVVPQHNKELYSNTDVISMVWERANYSEKYLQERQLKLADDFWWFDYRENLERGIQ